MVRISASFKRNQSNVDTTSSDSNSKLSEGTKVEARYRGKSKYYKGKVARARLNGTYDINYDDGEKELGVARELINNITAEQRSPGSRSRSRSVSEESDHRYGRRSSRIDATKSSSRGSSRSKSNKLSGRSLSSSDGSSSERYGNGSRRGKSGSTSKKKNGKNLQTRQNRRSNSNSKSFPDTSNSDSDHHDLSSNARRNRSRERQKRLSRFEQGNSSPHRKKIAGEFCPGDVVECCYFRPKHASKYTKPTKNVEFQLAKIRRFNSDGTYAVELASGSHDLLDAVPPKYIRDPGDADNESNSDASSSSKKVQRKRSRTWENVANLAQFEYDSKNSRGEKPSLSKATRESRRDDHKKIEILLGRKNLNNYQDVFEQYGNGRTGELEYEDVVDAYDALGRRCSLGDVKMYAKVSFV